MATVVIVDDQQISLRILEQLAHSLDEVEAVHSFRDPVAALDWVAGHEVDLALVDYCMPVIDGAEFIARFRALPGCEQVPLVVVTAATRRDVRYRALEAGATDFLPKPVDHVEFRARSRNLLTMRRQHLIIQRRSAWLERKVSEATEAVRSREYETLLRLAKAGEYRDEETGNHILRIARYSRLIAQGLGLPPATCEVIEIAAPMHDIGKIGIPDHVLLKPGPLTDAERTVMRRHVHIGHEILKGSPSMFLQCGAEIALAHHERWDGAGYPGGLAGAAIPLPARIVMVADVFDALISMRPYKTAWQFLDALDYIKRHAGAQFDPDCARAFLEARDEVRAIARQLADGPACQAARDTR